MLVLGLGLDLGQILVLRFSVKVTVSVMVKFRLIIWG